MATCEEYNTAVILAGGLGTRLRSAISDRPKALAPVQGRPFLSYLLDQLADAGVEQIILSVGYMGDQIEQAFGSRYRGIPLFYSYEREPQGTAGAIRLCRPMLAGRGVIVLNGDSYSDVDIEDVVSWHLLKCADTSLLLTRVTDCSQFGRVDVNAIGAVTRFREKSDTEGPGWVNAGIYVLSPAALARIEDDQVSFEYDTLPAWVGRSLFGLCRDVRFLDIGTPVSYQSAATFFSEVM